MVDYIYKTANFDSNLLQTAYNCEGYFDQLNLNKTELASVADTVVLKRKAGCSTKSGVDRYEFVITPNFGFLASPEPLLKDAELKISFDRASWKNALVEYATVTTPCTKLEIKDCHAVTEYVSSPMYRAHFDRISSAPILYNYEECNVYIKSIPLNDTEIRFDNLKGGNVPSYMFAGVIPQADMNGTSTTSCTDFGHSNVKAVNITLNGNSVHGYPMQIKSGAPIFPMHKFLDVTNSIYNINRGSAMEIIHFKYNWLWAHKFDADETSQGWVGISMKLTEAFTAPNNLVVWFITETALSIDKYHQVEKITF